MGHINGIQTVNGGTVKQFVASDHAYLVELMGKGYSTHPDNIVATYFMDEGMKTSLVVWSDKKDGEARICVYKYKAKDPLQHYYSRVYTVNDMPKKYLRYAKELIRAYSLEFNNGRMAFTYPREWGLV